MQKKKNHTDGEGEEERPEVSKWLESNLFP